MNYLVLEVTEEEKAKVQLKSALAGLSLEEFMKNTIQKHVQEHVQIVETTCSCGGETEIIQKPYHYGFWLGDKKKKMIILNLPQHKCSKCGSEGITSRAEKHLNKLLTLKINQWFRETGRLPEIVDFNELINF